MVPQRFGACLVCNDIHMCSFTGLQSRCESLLRLESRSAFKRRGNIPYNCDISDQYCTCCFWWCLNLLTVLKFDISYTRTSALWPAQTPCFNVSGLDPKARLQNQVDKDKRLSLLRVKRQESRNQADKQRKANLTRHRKINDENNANRS